MLCKVKDADLNFFLLNVSSTGLTSASYDHPVFRNLQMSSHF